MYLKNLERFLHRTKILTYLESRLYIFLNSKNENFKKEKEIDLWSIIKLIMVQVQ